MDHQVHPAHFHSKPDDASTRSGQLLLCLAKPCNPPGAEIQQPPASLFLSCTTLLVKKVFLLNCPNPTLPATVCDCDLLLYHLLTMTEVWVRHLYTFSSSTRRLLPYCFLRSSSPDLYQLPPSLLVGHKPVALAHHGSSLRTLSSFSTSLSSWEAQHWMQRARATSPMLSRGG